MMKSVFMFIFVMLLAPSLAGGGVGKRLPISENTQACLECHRAIFPGIVEDWKKSRMAWTTPKAAKSMISLKRRVSFDSIPDHLSDVSVGCAECHMMNPSEHPDTFDHNGYAVHVVVTPEDCAVCHPEERRQYGENIMSHAYGNLKHNAVYSDLVRQVNGVHTFNEGKISVQDPDEETLANSCFYCHGTVVEKTGMETRNTVHGPMEFPVFSGWPNQGVGRINPDESKGSCAACHTRHQFAIQMARKPATCSECHKGPDVPGYKVYEVSKHGNIYAAMGGAKTWDFTNVPWTVGEDFSAPTCATCHVSLLVDGDGKIIVRRTHRMNDRLAWRIMGLIYAHPQTKSPDTTIITNSAGLPLPTELTGEPVDKFLIDEAEQKKRQDTMKGICLTCHSEPWVEGQYALLEYAIEMNNKMTLTPTQVLLSAWQEGAAKGLAQNDSIFNEAIEKEWVEQWLFYANTTRYAAAMIGADYGVFANGRWQMSKNVQEMMDRLSFKLKDD